MRKSFYHYTLTYRGGEWADQKARFAEAMFEDPAFPKTDMDFEGISGYIEMHSDEYLTIAAFDELWELYAIKYSL